MNKARWLLWTVVIAMAVGATVVGSDSRRGIEATQSGAPFILDRINRMESFCPAHRIAMEVAKVPVVYGLPVKGDAIRAERFPHSRATLLAGCSLLPATNAWVYVCPECQRAENESKLARQRPK